MKLEVLEKDKYYHVYNRGINGTEIFFNEENKIFFLKQLNKYLGEKISLFAYCLMSNHFHLVLQLNKDADDVTQSLLSNFFNSYVKSVNKQNKRTGSLFEKHFKRICLVDENYLKQLILYVHLNPKYHLNLNFKDFKYSSYHSFLSKKETKLEREFILILFGGIENFIDCHDQKSDLLNEKHRLE